MGTADGSVTRDERGGSGAAGFDMAVKGLR